MKKEFEAPEFEVILFNNDDVVRTSSCCDAGGIPFPTDDDACPSGDAECACGEDIDQNCKTEL